MSLPKILPISWSLIPDRKTPDPCPPFQGGGNLRLPGDFQPIPSESTDLYDKPDEGQPCSNCIAHEITNWLPISGSNSLSASPCSQCLRGSSSNPSNHTLFDPVLSEPVLSAAEAVEAFFNSITLPTTPIHLNPYTTIHNLPLFISTHLSILKRYPGNRVFLPYIHRLLGLKNLLSNQ